MKALIVVDIQNDFLPGGALAVPNGDAVIPVINRLMEQFDLIIATQDWHPADHGSFAANHTDRAIGDTIDLAGVEQILWTTHCVQGSTGAEFAPELNTEEFTTIIQKGMSPDVDSYSGFCDNRQGHDTGLDETLKELNVNTVYIVGLATDYCVRYTALHAIQRGYETFLIEDACRGVNLSPNDTEEAIEEMRIGGVQIIHSDHV